MPTQRHFQRTTIALLCEYVCRFWPQLTPRTHRVISVDETSTFTAQQLDDMRDRQQYQRSLEGE